MALNPLTGACAAARRAQAWYSWSWIRNIRTARRCAGGVQQAMARVLRRTCRRTLSKIPRGAERAVWRRAGPLFGHGPCPQKGGGPCAQNVPGARAAVILSPPIQPSHSAGAQCRACQRGRALQSTGARPAGSSGIQRAVCRANGCPAMAGHKSIRLFKGRCTMGGSPRRPAFVVEENGSLRFTL